MPVPKVKLDVYFEGPKVTPYLRRRIKKVLSGKFFCPLYDRVHYVDVRGRLLLIHRWLRHSHLRYHVRNFVKVQRWKKDKLPVLIMVGRSREVVVWDGHHRVMAARLLGKPLRCRVVRITSIA